MKERIVYIDVARGITIILMVVGHVIPMGLGRDIIFSFHMPLFIIVSGYFCLNKAHLNTTEIVNSVKHLLIPYALTFIIIAFVNVLKDPTLILSEFKAVFLQLAFSYSYEQRIVFVDVRPVGVLWFIPFVFWGRLIFILLNQFAKENQILKLAVAYLLTLVGIVLGSHGIWLPYSFDVTLACTIFWFVGYIIAKYNLLSYLLNNIRIVLLFLVIWFLGIYLGTIELAVRDYPNYLIAYVTAICGTLCIFNVSKMIEKSKRFSNILTWYGENTFLILCIHHIEWTLVDYGRMGINSIPMLIIAKLSVITLAALGVKQIAILKKRLRL